MVVTSSTLRYGRKQGGEEAALAASAEASPLPTIKLSLAPFDDEPLEVEVADGSRSSISSVFINGTNGGLATVGGGDVTLDFATTGEGVGWVAKTF